MLSLGSALLPVVLVMCVWNSKATVRGKNLNGPDRCKIGCLLDDYYPLCGTDNKTYTNNCFLYLKNNCEKPPFSKVHKAYDGVCVSGQQGCELPCNGPGYSFNPICGSNGKTYDNECELNGRNKCDGTKIEKVHDGECEPSQPEAIPYL
ncbi:thrombin inhibitor rhodniin-like isoform X2 [Daphnia pulex]|uniref:thrombin inhibitor rhodniin-like isoform X2 n=1 Tax=Daphnia pulex TaxID=6669 RepID=UPI001EE05AC8|nr:thrombin inhibitor rhodniin-like isoform X2 [Daphnia pulex]